MYGGMEYREEIRFLQNDKYRLRQTVGYKEGTDMHRNWSILGRKGLSTVQQTRKMITILYNCVFSHLSSTPQVVCERLPTNLTTNFDGYISRDRVQPIIDRCYECLSDSVEITTIINKFIQFL